MRDEMRSRHSHRGCLVRVRDGARSRLSVERASYETDRIRGRGGLPFIVVSVVLVFLLAMVVGTPILLVPTQTVQLIIFYIYI
jgi:hypothetical protein